MLPGNALFRGEDAVDGGDGSASEDTESVLAGMILDNPYLGRCIDLGGSGVGGDVAQGEENGESKNAAVLLFPFDVESPEDDREDDNKET
jgi:hypothetical protein